jgi:hypothetical protein
MAAHRPVQPSLPHWLAHSSTVPAGILAPVATRFTAQSLRALPLSAPASRFLHQRGVQLTQAATCSAGSCDSAHEVVPCCICFIHLHVQSHLLRQERSTSAFGKACMFTYHIFTSVPVCKCECEIAASPRVHPVPAVGR